ncbi:MAG: threonine/serine exporter family protein [bacterium]|nr:threonine/serine exporter family protein [bacterium]
MNAPDLLWLVVQDAFWSAIAATGFAMVFNVPRRTLFGCAIAGATGHALRTLLMQGLNMPIEPATLAGATAVGALGILLSRRLRAPALIFGVCGAIPMVPGLFAYSAMIGFIRFAGADAATGNELLVTATINLVKTGLILAAIAAGIALPILLFRREKPVV